MVRRVDHYNVDVTLHGWAGGALEPGPAANAANWKSLDPSQRSLGSPQSGADRGDRREALISWRRFAGYADRVSREQWMWGRLRQKHLATVRADLAWRSAGHHQGGDRLGGGRGEMVDDGAVRMGVRRHSWMTRRKGTNKTRLELGLLTLVYQTLGTA